MGVMVVPTKMFGSVFPGDYDVIMESRDTRIARHNFINFALKHGAYIYHHELTDRQLA